MRTADRIRKIEQQVLLQKAIYVVVLLVSLFGINHWWYFLQHNYISLSLFALPVLIGITGVLFTGRQKRRVLRLYKKSTPTSMKLILQIKTVTFLHSNHDDFIALSTNGEPQLTAFLARTRDTEWEEEYEIPLLSPPWDYRILGEFTQRCKENEAALNAIVTQDIPDNIELPQSFTYLLERFPEPGVLELEESSVTVYISPNTRKVVLIETEYGPLWNWLEEGDTIAM